jgi:PleD family two-component response regulator
MLNASSATQYRKVLWMAEAKILINEDSRLIGELTSKQIAEVSHYRPYLVETMKEASELIEEHHFFAAIVNYTVPDSPDGETIRLTTAKKIPTIVFTSTLDERVRELAWKLKAVDYVLKEHIDCVQTVMTQLKRLERNPMITVVVADDSPFFRDRCRELLEVHRFRVIPVPDGLQALEAIEGEKNVQLVITDYSMPVMDGYKLCNQIRRRYGDSIGIIGVSSVHEPMLAAQFFKNGANDFLYKQHFLVEEFYCRVNHLIDNLIYIEQLRG